ncbi:MAG: hypothetical protein IPG27_21770 [Ottowia sp.]|nr:hypothetical protein [Ottowia sp.]
MSSTHDGRPYQLQVSADGGTVWLNGPDGSAVGRFSKRFGIDVHRSGTEQVQGLGECLFCTHEPAGLKEWSLFVAALREHYGVEVCKEVLVFDDEVDGNA